MQRYKDSMNKLYNGQILYCFCSLFLSYLRKKHGSITIKLMLYAIYLVNLSGNIMICLELLLLL